MSAAPHPDERQLIERIAQAIRSLKYGSIEVVVHDGRVVQIERRERVRLERDDARAPRTAS